MGATYIAAAGGDPEWTHVEPSFAVIGMSEEDARTLGREFGQDAIFGWSPTTMTVLSCDKAKVHMTGWDVLPAPASSRMPVGRSRRRRDGARRLVVSHGQPLQEPMLWVPDAVAGAAGDHRCGARICFEMLGGLVEMLDIGTI